MKNSRVVRQPRGGLILEALLALFLVIVGAVLWFGWNSKNDFLNRFGREKQSRGLPSAAHPEKDSVWLQYQVRDVLLKHGLNESHVLRTYNREQNRGKTRWVENILEVKAPKSFDRSAFRRDLERAIRKKGLGVRQETREKDRVLFELGDSERVFERLIFHLAG